MLRATTAAQSRLISLTPLLQSKQRHRSRCAHGAGTGTGMMPGGATDAVTAPETSSRTPSSAISALLYPFLSTLRRLQ